MKRVRVRYRSVPLLTLFVVLSLAAAATPSDREKWIIGRWTSHIEGRPDRTVVFHTDHRWGVEHYRVSGPNEQLTIYEDIRGRRWHIRGDKLVLRAPTDDGFKSYEEEIISFHHDKIVTDVDTYTREQPRKRPNQAMERTADRCAFHFEMTSTLSLRATRAFVRPRSSCSR